MATVMAPSDPGVGVEEVLPSFLSGVLSELEAALHKVARIDLESLHADDQLQWAAVFETQAARLDHHRVRIADSIDRTNAGCVDGHRSAKTAVQHLARLSSREAGARAQVSRALRDLPAWACAYAAGEVGTCQVRCIARVHANERVRDALIRTEERHLARAQRSSYKRFEKRCREWTLMADQDGTIDLSQRHHQNRDVRLTQDYDTSWRLEGGFGAWQGSMMRDIFDHFVTAERDSDWLNAKAVLGDDASYDSLARTENQRRADALNKIFEQAASALPDSERHNIITNKVITNIVIDSETYERELRRLAGEDPGDQDTFRANYRCSTSTGHTLTPTEAVLSTITTEFRRIIVDATGSVTDVSHLSRGFRGLIRHGALMQNDECMWPGCEIPAHYCEADHTKEHSRGGPTSLGNGGPACNCHNRHKTPEYHVFRTPDGEWHIIRPDGKQI